MKGQSFKFIFQQQSTILVHDGREKLDATAQQVTHLAEKLVRFLNEIKVDKIHLQAAALLVKPHCLLLAQGSKLVLEVLCTLRNILRI